jgi:ATP-dependent Lon protease
MATSLVSLIAGRKVKPHLGMTGEITLRGQVLPIGGVKEKVLAAHRNGLKTVILPERNKYDLEDVPDEVKQSMKFVFVQTMDDVLKAALETPSSAPRSTRRGAPRPARSKTRSKVHGKNNSRRR